LVEGGGGIGQAGFKIGFSREKGCAEMGKPPSEKRANERVKSSYQTPWGGRSLNS